MSVVYEARYSGYLFWLEKPYWTTDQAAFLLGGLDPDTFAGWSDSPDYNERQYYNIYFNMHRLITAAIKAKQINKRQSPAKWLEWATTRKLKVTKSLNAAVDAKWQEQPRAEANSAAGIQTKALGNRERNTLLVLIAALAKQAAIDLRMPSKAAAQMESATEQMGARIPQRTIEEHLKRIPEALEKRATR